MAPISYAQAVELLKAGDRVMVTNPDPARKTDFRRFHLIGAGAGLPATTFEKLKPDLVPVRDGLFRDDLSQTFVWGGAS